MYAERLNRTRARMQELGIDALLLSVGPDLPYLTGFRAIALDRITMLVVTPDSARIFVPGLEALRVDVQEDAFELRQWKEMEDPIKLIVAEVGNAKNLAIGDHTWARFLLILQEAMPKARFSSAKEILSPLRQRKDAYEIEALRAAAHAADSVARTMRDRPFGGRTEADVGHELQERLIASGHQQCDFWIVGSGPNSASPHHDVTNRVIKQGDLVVCDFGGTMNNYCSDITRTYSVGDPSQEILDTYAVLQEAQENGFQAAQVGTLCKDIDATARQVILDAGFKEEYILHRTGHGIGLEIHEDPYIILSNDQPLEAGNTFSIEPGIYFQGRYGMRLEDIVLATENGPERLNVAPHDLAIVG